MVTPNVEKNEIYYQIVEEDKSFTPIPDILDDDNFFSAIDYEAHNQINDTITNIENINIHDDIITAQIIDYSENYNMKMLLHISSYYNIKKNKLKKDDLIVQIIEYENNPENSFQVYNRRRYWHYIVELQNDPFFTKFVVFP